MKITKAKLKQIIKEELSSLSEGRPRGGGFSIASAARINSEETGHLMKSDGSMIMDQKTASSMLYHLENLMDGYHDIQEERELTPEETEELANLEAQYKRIMNAGLDAGYGA